jgi:hypothetical protein
MKLPILHFLSCSALLLDYGLSAEQPSIGSLQHPSDKARKEEHNWQRATTALPLQTLDTSKYKQKNPSVLRRKDSPKPHVPTQHNLFGFSAHLHHSPSPPKEQNSATSLFDISSNTRARMPHFFANLGILYQSIQFYS